MQYKIVFLDRSTLKIDIKRPGFPHHWEEFERTREDEVVARLKEADIAITNKVPLRRATLEKLPSLKMIAVAATGTDHIDIDFCRARGIVVANIRDYACNAVSEHVFMLILALRRNLLAYQEDIHAGLWSKSDQFCLFTHPIHDIHGSTLGIIGYGALGQAVARLAKAFGMQVLLAEHKNAQTIRSGRTPFETVLSESDIVTLHCPLTPDTRNLISLPELKLMKSSSLLINTARGGVVDENALALALQEGLIAGAGFDVLSIEPPREDHVLLKLNQPNFILTPHIAWASEEAMSNLADQLIENIESFVRGNPQNLVT
ncbi:D-2-hydroxyacid dehydrogenase [Desulfohalobiaceae bacterium Ax17]|uniref:D-2-hydroxyacid dehydrogenase n=1 Tax=Desulfovulcanus ferrireducens TaxID=2831190 RepID=UPI00207BBFEF|nr:D-2-hydroxyacid dehydrogenase [Desulfovulcanus ferrireducens]MBT8762818.1 D-2-hydroxyacid dehydrogenase [Desulfovulcanus ferrireducens]